jgi:hypothetical protein
MNEAIVTTFRVNVTQTEYNLLCALWQAYCQRTGQIIALDTFVEKYLKACIGEIVV